MRIWRLDATSLEVAAQYLYPFDTPDSFARDRLEGPVDWSDLKVSELVCVGEERLLVLERCSRTTKIYRVTLDDDCMIAASHLDVATRPTVEEQGPATDLPMLGKELVFTSDDSPEVAADLEGMAMLSERELLLVNDNDFGVEGASTQFWLVEFADAEAMAGKQLEPAEPPSPLRD